MILDGLRKFFLARFFATFFFHQGYYKQKGTKQCSGRNRAVRLPGTEEKGMKKNAKRIVALGIAGILLLTGCGGKADTSSPAGADGTTRQEAPSEAAWELPEADFGNAEGTTADSGMESPSESAAVENAADAADGMLMEEEMDGAAGRYADISETPQNSYSTGSSADEWKMEGAEELN